MAMAMLLLGGYFWIGRAPRSLEGSIGAGTYGLHMNVNEVATWGGLDVRNTGSRPLVLDSLTLHQAEGAADGVKFLRMQVVATDKLGDGPRIGMSGNAGADVIPEGLRSPLDGYELPASSEVSVLIQYQALREGSFRYDTATFDYHEGSRTGQLTVVQALDVCVPADAECDLPRL
ncbi:hypothetical protein GCM10027456_20670 [Kineosporia babensis]